MGLRRKGPTLIELVRDRAPASIPIAPSAQTRDYARPSYTTAPAPSPTPTQRSAPAPARAQAGADADESPWPAAEAGPPAPIGRLLLLVAGAVVLIIVGYSIGYARRQSEERARIAANEPPIPGPEDPLNKPLANQVPDPRAQKAGQPGGAASTPQKQQIAGAPKPTPDKPAAKPEAPAPAKVDGDPRTPGLNYFVLADRISPEEAQKAADFLSSHGLAANVVFSNNASIRRVIATKGFAGSEVSGADAARLKADAARIGALYKSQERGPVDFAKPFPEKFQP